VPTFLYARSAGTTENEHVRELESRQPAVEGEALKVLDQQTRQRRRSGGNYHLLLKETSATAIRFAALADMEGAWTN
jgi:hypothetical protein